jgi:hypothetical protein
VGRGDTWRRLRFITLALMLSLAAAPGVAGAQGTAAPLAGLALPSSLANARPDGAPIRDACLSSPRESAGQSGFTLDDVLDPIPKTSSINWQPTYEHRTNGSFNAYVKFKPVLVIESGLPLVTRIEWPLPEVDDENGPTNAGVGDLTWLTLFLLGSSKAWGVLGMGPVFVFPTASHSEMGEGKYQIGPGLGYLNKAVTGWKFALVLQQYFSFAGDPQRSRVNRLTLQPFVTKLLPDSWYVQTQPVITVDFAKGTSSVPLNLVVGRLFDGRWNVSLQATGYPGWTSPPSKEYEIRLSIGYNLPALFSKR